MPHADRAPAGKKFGDVIDGKDVAKTQFLPGETVTATFHGANPRNNQRAQGSFLAVQRLAEDQPKRNQQEGDGDEDPVVVETVAYDGDWLTKFSWQAGPDDPLDLGFTRTSEATLSWTIPTAEDMVNTAVPGAGAATPGKYRLCYSGDHKMQKSDKSIAFTGCSLVFEVLPQQASAATVH
mmetsp:Transcript_9408/g.15559  ORF Transcript_9408/g.15559 Transcript_9408/m.15559 type:complete len:180 (-) Transcript_9408:446-985(-)